MFILVWNSFSNLSEKEQSPDTLHLEFRTFSTFKLFNRELHCVHLFAKYIKYCMALPALNKFVYFDLIYLPTFCLSVVAPAMPPLHIEVLVSNSIFCWIVIYASNKLYYNVLIIINHSLWVTKEFKTCPIFGLIQFETSIYSTANKSTELIKISKIGNTLIGFLLQQMNDSVFSD